MSRARLLLGLSLACVALPLSAGAQPLGSFTWQLQPFCNRVTVNVRQDGAVYTLDGTDNQCGASQKAPLVGVAAPNPDGSIGFGLNIVSPSGQPVPVQARILVSTLSGTWRDSGGNSGTFAFGGGLPGLPPRPLPTTPGDITRVTAGTGLTGGGPAGDVTLEVDATTVQSRVTTACPAGQAIRSIAQSGTAVCEPITGSAGGDITAVHPGLGLTGGGDNGDVTLNVVFAGDGVSNGAARADHEHLAGGSLSVGVGPGALAVNTDIANTALGANALALSTTGVSNTSVGANTLTRAQTTADNTAVGSHALRLVTASTNTAVGSFSSDSLTTGNRNTALGAHSLQAADTGASNVAVGTQSLFNLTSGSRNVALGDNAATALATGLRTTAIGYSADVGGGSISNSTAIGAHARVDVNNAIVLGAIQGTNGGLSDVNVGVGTTAPGARLEIASDNEVQEIRMTVADGEPDLVGRASSGTRAVPTAVQEGGVLLYLRGQGFTGSTFQEGAGVVLRAAETWSATAHGSSIEFQTTVLGTTSRATRVVIDELGDVGIGTTNPQARLHVAGGMRLEVLGSGGTTQICHNTFSQLAFCSSSLRYKSNITPFDSGLAFLERLRPISFTWKSGGARDVGFGAEDVAAVDPRFAVFNDAGEVEGVKYDRLTTVLVNAVKEQQAIIDALRRERSALEERLAAVERAIGTIVTRQ